MRIVSSMVIVIVFLVSSTFIGGAQTPTQNPNVSKVIDTYCSGCHNGSMKSPSGALLDRFDAAQISANPDVWSRAYRQLQAGTMPPVGAARPERATYDAVLASVEQALGATAKPHATATSPEIASRLATLLWNGAPDASLLEDAQHDRLIEPATLELQIRRMLADNRAEAFISRFFFPWLELDKLSKADPDKKYFPDYDVSLRDSLARETELFLLSQLRDDRDPLSFGAPTTRFSMSSLPGTTMFLTSLERSSGAFAGPHRNGPDSSVMEAF